MVKDMDTLPSSKVVKLGDILPSLATFESVLGSLKSYRLWPVVLREALLDKAISGITCSQDELEEAWRLWCLRNEVDQENPVFEGLSLAEMRHAALREKRLEKFKEQAFARLLPEYFRSRKADMDRVTLELVQFHHAAVAEEALFRCRGGEQALEVTAHELAHQDGGEPPIKRIGPIPMRRLSAGLSSLVTGGRNGLLLGPKKIGHFYVIVRILEVQEASLDERTRQRLLEELLNQWVEQQMAVMTGRPARKTIEESSDLKTE
jgi:hypothetical protein